MKSRVLALLFRAAFLLLALPAFARTNGPAAGARPLTAPGADVVAYSDGPAEIAHGADLAYFLDISCAGPDSSGEVTYTWTTPPGTVFLSLQTIALDPPARPASTNCTTPDFGSTGTVTCTVPGGLAPPSNNGGTLSIIILHMRVLQASGDVTNRVTATSANDPSLANNTSSATTHITGLANVDAAVSLTGPSIVEADTPVAYEVTLGNHGTAASSDFRLTFVAPAGASIDSFSPAGVDCYQPSAPPATLLCRNMVVVPSGWSASVAIKTHLSGTPGVTATASAHVTGDGGDPNPANNDVTFTSMVTAANAPDLRIDPAAVNAIPAQPFTFTAHVENRGISPLLGLVVEDAVPPGMSLVSATPSAGTCNVTASSLQCQADTLAPGASLTITIVATPPPANAVDHIVATAGTQAASADLQVNVLTSSRHRAVRH
jgi:uncharacterized repeat protein (TIGR01451 family)